MHDLSLNDKFCHLYVAIFNIKFKFCALQSDIQSDIWGRKSENKITESISQHELSKIFTQGTFSKSLLYKTQANIFHVKIMLIEPHMTFE